MREEVLGRDGDCHTSLMGCEEEAGIVLIKSELRVGRIGYIDLTRGVIFILMISAHALFLSGVSSTSNLQGWVPRGWATTSFIMLSGFSVGVIYSLSKYEGQQSKRLLRRSRQIAIVMFMSNVFLLLCKYLLRHDLVTISSPVWWIGLFTFKTEYSISGVLIPTCLLLILLAFIIERFNLLSTLLLVVMLFVLNQIFISNDLCSFRGIHIVNLMFGKGVSGFPLIPFLNIGLIGYLLGKLWSVDTKLTIIFLVVLVMLKQFFLDSPLDSSMHVNFWKSVLVCTARFSILLFCSCCISFFLKNSFITKIVGSMGKFALFSFVAHRIVLQALFWAVEHSTITVRPELLYISLVITTIATIYAAITIRQRHSTLDLLLSRIYL